MERIASASATLGRPYFESRSRLSRPRSSLQTIAKTLAAISAVGPVACGGSAPPPESAVEASEVPAATEATPAPSAEPAAEPARRGSRDGSRADERRSRSQRSGRPQRPPQNLLPQRPPPRRLLPRRSPPPRRRRQAPRPAVVPEPAAESMTADGAPASASQAARSVLPNGVGLGLRWEFLEEVLDGPPLDVAFFEVSPENYMRRGGFTPPRSSGSAIVIVCSRMGSRSRSAATALPIAPFSRSFATSSCVSARLFTPTISRSRSPASACCTSFCRSSSNRRRSRGFLTTYAPRRTRSGYRSPSKAPPTTATRGGERCRKSEFIARTLEASGAGLLLDVNNVYVNSRNHGFDPSTSSPSSARARRSTPRRRSLELEMGPFDRHARSPVLPEVEELLGFVIERTGPRPVLLERDNDVPPCRPHECEVARLRGVYDRALSRRALQEESRAVGA